MLCQIGQGGKFPQWLLDMNNIEKIEEWIQQSHPKRVAERIAELEKIAGLRSNPKIEAAIQKHLKEEYKKIKLDSCGSAMHKLYETGDAMLGNSIVVEWSDRQVWFSLDGDDVEMVIYPNRAIAIAIAKELHKN